MITEDYVSFETAKLLKENGFEGRMHTFYTEEGAEMESAYVVPSNFFPIYRPTLQMAMKWLREVHNLCINSDFTIHGWSCSIALIVRNSDGDIIDVEDSCDWETPYCDTYEEAVEYAIKYCLENLI